MPSAEGGRPGAAIASLEALIAETRAMREAAEAHDWAGVGALDAGRLRLLGEVLAAPPEPDALAAGLDVVVQLDQEIHAIGRQDLAALERAIAGQRRGRRMDAAYGGLADPEP